MVGNFDFKSFFSRSPNGIYHAIWGDMISGRETAHLVEIEIWGRYDLGLCLLACRTRYEGDMGEI